MNWRKQLHIFVTGVLLLAPFALTAYVLYVVGNGLDNWVRQPFTRNFLPAGTGLVLLLVLVYLVGLLGQWWAVKGLLRALERLVLHLPLAKTLYEAVRDIAKLFGGQAGRLGQTVRLKVPGSDSYVLGIRTSTSPRGAAGDAGKVAVYVPMSYQLGGFTIYAPAGMVQEVDIPVEEALKLAATAEAGSTSDYPAGNKPGS
jgi:uncharacterized membrane protein